MEERLAKKPVVVPATLDAEEVAFIKDAADTERLRDLERRNEEQHELDRFRAERLNSTVVRAVDPVESNSGVVHAFSELKKQQQEQQKKKKKQGRTNEAIVDDEAVSSDDGSDEKSKNKEKHKKKKHKKNKKNKKHKKSKQQSADGGRGVSIRLIAEAGEQQALDSVTLEFRRSDNESLAGVVDLPASEQDASSTLIAMSGVAGGQRGESGDAMSLVVSADAVTNTHTVTAKLTVVGNGDRKVKKRVKFQVAPSTFLAPQALSIEELQTGPLASGSSKTTSGQQLVTLRDGLTVQTALKDLSRVLNAHLVDARSFKALYHAADRVTGTYACALVSANKDDLSHIQVEIKSNATDQSFVDALLAEVQRAFAD
eukprot:TRINITY_DN67928_c5_g3_i2.p2 TRINITY_DN67928_c5_g3~~TRINITY_DN67928_c5_g3_i2.p2  ORF type:complete len:371 (+),score=241.31 TRINITY_DN67928_c5_g3_i2:275-1387(+)